MEVLIAILITSLGWVPGLGKWLYTKYRPLEIKPSKKEVILPSDNWNEDFFTYLVNHTNNTYYGVQIAIEFPKNIDVSIIPEEKDFSLLGAKNKGFLVGNNFSIGLENENKGITQAIINNIGPEEKLSIKIVVNKKYNDSSVDSILLNFKIDKYSKEPKSILRK